MGSAQEPTKSAPLAPAYQICTKMLFAAVKLLLLPSALGLVRFPPVQKVPRDLRFCEDDPTALSSDPTSDAYIDQILANLATVIIENGLDPATLPDADTGFSDTILGITFHGSAHLFNGKFWRLSTIHRTGETSFTTEGTKIRLTANIGVEAPTAHYDASAEFMGIGVSAGITANIADFGIYIDAEMDIANGGGLQLTNFQISHVGHIDIDVSGLGPLDWILELLVDFVDTFLKDWIVSLVEGPLKDLIQQILDDCVPDFPPAVAHI